MKIEAKSVEDYIHSIPQERLEVFNKLWNTIKKSIPYGFEEYLSYGFPSFVVPLKIYPQGYHCKKNEPLPFISLGNQKNFIALYHLGIYSSTQLLEWFQEEYKKLNIGKLDMGKSCIRLKPDRTIPYELIGELCSKLSVQEWVELYNSKRI